MTFNATEKERYLSILNNEVQKLNSEINNAYLKKRNIENEILRLKMAQLDDDLSFSDSTKKLLQG